MKQVNIYQVYEKLLKPSLCQLIEKCYSNQLITTLIVNNESINEIDNLLWTYSQKSFIPHGHQLDQLPEQQPIYISSEFVNVNNSSTLLMFDPSEAQWQTFNKFFLDQNDQAAKFTKAIIICSDDCNTSEYKKMISQHDNISLNCFYKSSDDSKWLKED